MACQDMLLQQKLSRREIRALDSTQSAGFPSAHSHSPSRSIQAGPINSCKASIVDPTPRSEVLVQRKPSSRLQVELCAQQCNASSVHVTSVPTLSSRHPNPEAVSSFGGRSPCECCVSCPLLESRSRCLSFRYPLGFRFRAV